MSKYRTQDTIDEEGKKLLGISLDSRFFLHSDLGAKDNYPDIDGQLRLRDGEGKYLNLFFHYQLKSTQNLRSEKFYINNKIVDYLLTTNIPTILFIADVDRQKVYWFFLDKQQKSEKEINVLKSSGYKIDLHKNNFSKNDSPRLNQLFRTYAKEDDYDKLNVSVRNITTQFHQDIQKCLGLVFLLKRVPKNNLVNLFHQILQIEKDEIELIIKKLVDESIVSETVNFYLIDNERLGTESLYKLLSELDLNVLEKTFKDESDRKRIVKQLATIDSEIVQNYFLKLSSDLLELVKISTNNDEVFTKLEFLEIYAFRVSARTLEIVNNIVNKEPIPTTEINYAGIGFIKGKSHLDLTKKCIEILDRIRYQEKDIFNILIKLEKEEEKTIKSEAIKVLERLCKYDIHALRNVGYNIQEFVIEKIEQWNESELIRNKDILLQVAKCLLKPDYQGSSMKDYKTITIHSGALKLTDTLRNIRIRTITVLEKLYSFIKDLETRMRVLVVLEEASHTPVNSNYGDDIAEMVVNNTNGLIQFYISLLPAAENEIIKIIEEQLSWFSRRFGSKKLSRLEELRAQIDSKTEYELFRVLIGYDSRFEEEKDWKKVQKIRSEKIQEFVDSISETNISDWEKKILAVITNFPSSRKLGELRYFNIFLYEYAKQKPLLSLQTIKKPELEPFIIHLLGGLWNSSLQKEARKLINEWIKTGRYLSESANLFEYVGSLDIGLLKRIFRKAKRNKDIQALNNVICSVVRNYSKNENQKQLFIKAIDALTKNNDYSWINNVWYLDGSIFENMSIGDLDIILNNLLIVPSIEYHVEEILMPITKQYPEKIIDLFFKRVVIQSKQINSFEERYEAIPFNLHKINEPLRQQETVVVPMLFTWYRRRKKETSWLFESEASHLFEEIFPDLSGSLEGILIKLINSNQKDALKIVFSIINRRRDDESLWSVVKAIVDKYTNSNKYEKIKRTLFNYLLQTDTVTGEYGFVEAYRGKKDQIHKYINDPDINFRVFVQSYDKYLDQTIDYEQKRADEDIELRKRDIDY